MSAIDLVNNPDALRQEAERARKAASLAPTPETAAPFLAFAASLDAAADTIDSLSLAERADLIAMLASIRPN